jgi:hypothetical protein
MTEAEEIKEKINKLSMFKIFLRKHEDNHDAKLREWLNQEVAWVKAEVTEAGCYGVVTLAPPPAIGGLVLRDVDPFSMMFERPGRGVL